MKTLFLLGDSIRMFYCERVAEMLAGKMKVVWPAENCRFSLYTLRCLWEWADLVENPADVAAVHWNNGLWDITRRTIDGECLTSREEYARNLERILLELRGRFPQAQIIFATTTYVDPRLAHVHNEDVDAYNAVALRVMAHNNIPVNDLHAIMAAHPEYIRQDDWIHETEEGAYVLAEHIVRAVERVLSEKN